MICDDCKYRYWTPDMNDDELKCVFDNKTVIHRTKSNCPKYEFGNPLYWKKSILDLKKEVYQLQIKCPYCGFEYDYVFLGDLWKGLKKQCKNCKKEFGYHIETGYNIEEKEVEK